jgi:hypothetical protein
VLLYWIHLAQDTDESRAVVNTVMNLGVPYSFVKIPEQLRRTQLEASAVMALSRTALFTELSPS